VTAYTVSERICLLSLCILRFFFIDFTSSRFTLMRNMSVYDSPLSFLPSFIHTPIPPPCDFIYCESSNVPPSTTRHSYVVFLPNSYGTTCDQKYDVVSPSKQTIYGEYIVFLAVQIEFALLRTFLQHPSPHECAMLLIMRFTIETFLLNATFPLSAQSWRASAAVVRHTFELDIARYLLLHLFFQSTTRVYTHMPRSSRYHPPSTVITRPQALTMLFTSHHIYTTLDKLLLPQQTYFSHMIWQNDYAAISTYCRSFNTLTPIIPFSRWR